MLNGRSSQSETPAASLPAARRLEAVSPGGAYLLMAAVERQRTSSGPVTR